MNSSYFATKVLAYIILTLLSVLKAAPTVAKRTMAGLSGSVIELSNYLEQRISQKSAEYAAVSF